MNIAKTETAVCGGSNLKAPMKLDFLRSLCAQDRHVWPEVVLCRVEGEPLPVCCLSEAAAGDLFSRVGIVSAPSEALTALLHGARAGAGHGTVRRHGRAVRRRRAGRLGLSRRIPLRRSAQRRGARSY